jgi:hypothetical protein
MKLSKGLQKYNMANNSSQFNQITGKDYDLFNFLLRNTLR